MTPDLGEVSNQIKLKKSFKQEQSTVLKLDDMSASEFVEALFNLSTEFEHKREIYFTKDKYICYITFKELK